MDYLEKCVTTDASWGNLDINKQVAATNDSLNQQ